MSSTAPVLLLFFNRPDLAASVFARVREARPPRLFLAVDGAREGRGEESAVSKNREFATQVDWPCEVQTLFRDQNLGCGPAVSEAISWFFSHVELGIILEDDCVPDLSFFQFASELLERYRESDQVMMINGTSYVPTALLPEESYYFSKFGHIWGWASWRRAWEKYDYHLKDWPENQHAQDFLQRLGFLPKWHLNRNFALTKSGEINTWDYQWEHTVWANNGLVIAPSRNIVSNIGFDERATHTFKGDDGRAGRKSRSMAFPLIHPDSVKVHAGLDEYYRKHYLMSFPMLINVLLRKLGNALGWSWLRRRQVYEAPGLD